MEKAKRKELFFFFWFSVELVCGREKVLTEIPVNVGGASFGFCIYLLHEQGRE